MKTPLACLNLLHEKTRTLVAVAGVAFAVILIFMQLGFRGSVLDSANLLYDKLCFDIALISPDYLNSGQSSSFSRERLAVARSLPAVKSAVPFYIGFNRWLNRKNMTLRHIMILGFRIDDQLDASVFKLKKLQVEDPRDRVQGLDVLLRLHMPDQVLMDTLSNKAFGPKDEKEFGLEDIRTKTEVGDRQIEIVGTYTMGGGFGADGTIIVSDKTFARISDGWSLDNVSLGLIRVQPNESPQQVARALRKVLPPDVKVLTRAELEAQELKYWNKNTPTGIIFSMGVVVALIVGVVFVYQVISSDITNQLPEYATLKAIGYNARYLNLVVLQQAVLMAMLGYLPGLVIAAVLYQVTEHYTHLPIHMDLGRDALVLTLAILMCAASGFFSLHKLRAADPADLF